MSFVVVAGYIRGDGRARIDEIVGGASPPSRGESCSDLVAPSNMPFIDVTEPTSQSARSWSNDAASANMLSMDVTEATSHRLMPWSNELADSNMLAIEFTALTFHFAKLCEGGRTGGRFVRAVALLKTVAT